MHESSIESIVRYQDHMKKAYIAGDCSSGPSLRLDLLVSLWRYGRTLKVLDAPEVSKTGMRRSRQIAQKELGSEMKRNKRSCFEFIEFEI